MDPKNKCHLCEKTFSKLSNRNRHLKDVHKEEPLEGRSTKHIKCPLCIEKEKTSLASHDNLIKHLEDVHSLTIRISIHHFENKEEFEAWRCMSDRNIDYVFERGSKTSNNEEYIYYNCNRSNTTGFVSNCTKRSMKKGGSVKISGLCPSRISVKVKSSGVEVKYIETHAGHNDELRSKHLSKTQQVILANKLMAGVTKERILEDARYVNNGKLDRMNLLTRTDLSYIIRKFNVNKQRDPDDMTAIALKVQELNTKEENTVFLYKKIGESHPELQSEDFAIAFMNTTMERKLREFRRIICIDGTHGTNIRNYELTIILVKDENNVGFPVSFLITNRLDQRIQNIFFRSLKERIGETLICEYIMTDDDPKYFNAWCQEMVTEEKPRRLLCTWHVIKNWNIQGRNKLKKIENKKGMKYRMRAILKETDQTKFVELKEDYFKYLESEHEYDFLQYLQKYYFQSNERIEMWSHCYRMNAGINTNMAIESLNKVIKYNKMRGNQNLRIEKLLDVLEDLVKDKMWKKVIDLERPNANSYQSRVNREAHIKAEKEVLGKVIVLDSGEFKVFSTSNIDKSYIVKYNELCDDECRTMYCDRCKICIHKFKCQCPEYTIKTALCKHIHAVALIEKRSDFVVGPGSSVESPLCIDEPSTSRARNLIEVENFIEQTTESQKILSIDLNQNREIIIDEIVLKLKSLDREKFDKMAEIFNQTFNRWQTEETQIGRKRKIEKQLYYPNKK